MLNAFNCVIDLKQSKLYVKCCWIVIGIAAIVVLDSHLNEYLKLTALVVFAFNAWSIYQFPYPQTKVKQIAFITDHWQVVTSDGTEYYYEKHRFLAELGAIFLLQLTGSHSCTLVIFKDQIDEKIYRRLKVLEKVRS